jgi:penicillin-binding protein 2
MIKRLAWLLLFFIAACSSAKPIPATPTPEPTSPAPAPEATAQDFLSAWEKADYVSMFNLLSAESQAGLTPDSFANRYRAAQTTATVKFVRAPLQAVLTSGGTAQATYHLEWDTALFDTLSADHEMTLTLEDDQWRIQWNDGLIWPGLQGGNAFQIEYQIPNRANIYDRDGKVLANDGKVVTVGIVPGQIEDEAKLLDGLSPIVNLTPDKIKAKYAAANPDWFVPIADISFEASQANQDFLKTAGFDLREKAVRLYSGIAPHAIGYVSLISPESLDQWKARGYRGDEWVGASGLEEWGESYLGGSHGGTLSIIDPNGQVVGVVADKAAVPSRSLYTTIDRSLQEATDTILQGHKGAIVVLNPKDGEVLAMSSYPSFNPNALISPYASGAPTETSFLNRATQGAYPPGSTFKPVTMAAGMEEGGYVATSPFFDPGYWDGYGEAFRKTCWLPTGHGNIDLQTGLSASCDVVFYTVGKTLQEKDPNILPRFAKGFGLGHTTAITGVVEVDGTIPDPQWKQQTQNEVWLPGDTINMAIGQGYVQATPLQMAVMYAAIANGGTLYRPRIIQKIGSNNEPPEEGYQPEVLGQLPVSATTLKAIQDGLHGVIVSPRGTAGFVFKGFPYSLAGKTGTAETGGPNDISHAWFVAYAPFEDPQIVVVVFLENGGQGSYNAAPLARNVLESYFGLPLTPPPAAPPPGAEDR